MLWDWCPWRCWSGARCFGGLGPDPVKAIERGLGERGLQFLLASLAITPLRRVGLNLLRFRRALGLLSFTYVALHLTAWVWLDMGLRWSEMVADLWKRPYIILGMVGFLAMLPLAVTSTNAAIRRMGAAAWARLHRLAYVAILAGSSASGAAVKGLDDRSAGLCRRWPLALLARPTASARRATRRRELA